MKIQLSQKNQANWYLMIVYSLFLLGAEIRNGISETFFPINILYFIALSALIYINRTDIANNKLLIIILLIFHLIIVNILNGVEMRELFRAVLYYHLPCIILIIRYEKINIDYKALVKKILKLINIFILIIFSIFLIDSVTNGLIMRNLVILTPNIAGWIPDSYELINFRYASYIGHYLATSEIYLMFFLLNKSYEQKCKEYLLNKYLVYVIAILGVISTGSKTGIVLLSISMIHTSSKGNNKVKGVFLLAFIYFFLEVTGLSELAFRRFINETSLTTGRNEALTLLLNTEAFNISLYKGFGMKTIEHLSSFVNYYQVTIAMEYPMVNYLISYGWLSTLTYIYIIFLNPLFSHLKRRRYYYAGCLVIVFVNINTFNWLSSVPDAIIFYLLFVIIIRFISLIPEEK